MNILFYAIALCMSLIATLIVAQPMLSQAQQRERGFARVGLLTAVIVVLLAIGLYAAIGRPSAAGVSHSATAGMTTNTVADASTSSKVGSVTSMLTGLEERLAKNPEDGSGWLLLAKSYQHLGRTDDARVSYEKAAGLGFADAEFADLLGGSTPKTSAGAEIRGRVTLTDAAKEQLADSDTVFVVAKAASGSPMPLAVLRKPASSLPFDFVLNDSLSMVQGQPLSGAQQVIVSVKISRSGDALQTDAGLQAVSEPVSTNDSPFLTLHLDSAGQSATP